MISQYFIKVLCIVHLIVLWVNTLVGQISIVGQVIDDTGARVIGANVLELGTSNGVITNEEGVFELVTIADVASIEISYIGYQNTLIENLQSDSDIHVVMSQSQDLIECEVIIQAPHVGYIQNFSRLNSGDILLNPSANIGESLNETPGVIMQSGTYGTSRLTMRGIGSRNQFGTAKILGYWNGIPLSNTRGELAIDDLNLNFVDRVDIMRGPTSPTFGSALGGVLRFETTMPRHSGIQSSVSIGNFSLVSQSHIAKISAMSNRLTGKLGFASFASDGWRQNNQYDRRNMNAHLTYTAGRLSNLMISAFIMNTEVVGEIPSSLNLTDYEFDPTLAASNWYNVRGNEDYHTSRIGLSVKYSTISNWLFKTGFSMFRYKNDELRPFNTLSEDRQGTSYRLVASKEELFNHQLKIEAGVEILSETYDWVTSIDDMIIDNYLDDGLNLMEFANLQYRFAGAYELMVGISVSQHHYQLFGQESSSLSPIGNHRYTNISPSLKLKHSQRYNQMQYLSVSHGFSPPNSDEVLTSENMVNTQILPETGWTYEAGAKDYRNAWKYDITVYYMPTRNLLVPQRISEETTIGVNAGRTRHVGLELATHYDEVKTGKVEHDFSAMITVSHNRFIDFVLDDIQYSGNDVTGIAPLTSAFGWKSRFKGVELNVKCQYRGNQPIDDANTVYASSYTIVNASLGYQKSFFVDIPLHVFGRFNINNVLDQHYASMVLVNASSFGGNLPRYYYPGMPRNIAATFGFSVDLLSQ